MKCKNCKYFKPLNDSYGECFLELPNKFSTIEAVQKEDDTCSFIEPVIEGVDPDTEGGVHTGIQDVHFAFQGRA